MKIRTIALSTFGSFLHNRVLLLFCSLFVCIVLLMMAPLLTFKAMTTAANAQQMQGMVLNEVAVVMSLVSGFGSLLAAWTAASTVSDEMKSGTILAVMARPLRRWEYLCGKYLGALMLMAVYDVAMLAVTFLLAWLGGQRFHTALWTLVLYPMVRYAIWAAISMLLVTVLHPAFVMAIVVVVATLVGMFGSPSTRIPNWVRVPVHVVLPMTNLLSEERFLSITRASLKPFGWKNHIVALTYGVDYALVCLLLATAVFHYRSLTRD